MKQRVISGKLLRLFGAMLLAFAAVLCVSVNASAATVSYVDENGVSQTADATSITSSSTSLSSGWYIVDSSVTVSSRITVSGSVNLILGDGYTLTASAGITVNSGNSLTIYGQSGGTGALKSSRTNIYYASIGSNSTYSNKIASGTITINGGMVTASGYYGAGIGSGSYGSSGTITINGGTVTASSYYGAGIGSGFYGSSGTIIINDGTVTATSTSWGAGIGGGYRSTGGTIEISGGTIEATGGSNAAGIGGGNSGDGGMIEISGGTIEATGGNYYGAGIGGGIWGSGGTITISDGNVTATGGDDAAAIGGGNSGSCGTITISGGYLTLSKGSNSPNYIGAGYDGSDGTISITGGYYVIGDVENQLVYDVSPDVDYYVIPNTETLTMGTYPYLVSSTIPVFYSSATAEKVYDGTTAFDEYDIDITFEDINGNEATGIDYTATGDTSSADAGIYTDGLPFEASVGTGYILLDTDYSAISTLQKAITATITQKEITVSSVTVANKVYDGTTAVDSSAISLTFTDGTSEVTLTEGTDYTVSAVYDSAEVGTQSVTVTVTLLNSNYTLTTTTYTTTSTIAEQGLTFTADVASKVYDGTTDVDDSAITLT
ncbi:MAG: YDG domain-containing protein, partial [Oscillospiraceae bacterium]|nr:YDG domain-containing protein [Oscillospiraceae bacterium]